MNIALFGYILAWLGVIYCIIAVVATIREYNKLSPRMQQSATINIAIPLIILVVSLGVSLGYIITYHIS